MSNTLIEQSLYIHLNSKKQQQQNNMFKKLLILKEVGIQAETSLLVAIANGIAT